MAYLLALVTVPDAATGEKLAHLLVSEKLAACVNRVPGLASTYWWEGKVETAGEELLLIKTEKTRFKELVKTVKANHPYSVPEVISFRIKEGSRDYLKWLGESVGAVKARPRTKGKKTRARKQSARDKKRNAREAKKQANSQKKG